MPLRFGRDLKIVSCVGKSSGRTSRKDSGTAKTCSDSNELNMIFTRPSNVKMPSMSETPGSSGCSGLAEPMPSSTEKEPATFGTPAPSSATNRPVMRPRTPSASTPPPPVAKNSSRRSPASVSPTLKTKPPSMWNHSVLSAWPTVCGSYIVSPPTTSTEKDLRASS